MPRTFIEPLKFGLFCWLPSERASERTTKQIQLPKAPNIPALKAGLQRKSMDFSVFAMEVAYLHVHMAQCRKVRIENRLKHVIQRKNAGPTSR